MPPALDIYVVSPQRSRETIELFLNTYVDRVISEDRGDEELMLVAIDSSGQPCNDEWEWEPSKNLTHIVQRGLDFPRRAFTAYLQPKDISLTRAVLAFNTNDEVIFGLSLDDDGEKNENLVRAKTLLHEIAEFLGGRLGLILVEEPPPLFDLQRHHLTPLYAWSVEGQIQ